MPTPQRRVWPIAALLLSAVTVHAAPLEERVVTTFLGELRRAIAGNDHQAVAAMIQYPLTVMAGGMRIPVTDRAGLLQNYDVVFSPGLKAAIAQAAIPVPGRPPPTYRIAIGDAVATVGGDLIKMEPLAGVLKITRIPEPLAPVDVPTPIPSGAAKSAVEHQPRRLALTVGQTKLSGALAAGGRDSYVISAAKNQLIEVRIDGVSGRDIVARVLGMKTRQPLDARARDGARVWSGRVPDAAAYEIEIVRLATAGGSRLPYVLTISMR
jgi:hypothetical protein